MNKLLSRRTFIGKTILAGALLHPLARLPLFPIPSGYAMKPGFVTYQWGKDWDLPTLIENCSRAGLLGVELRTQHAHGVETTLNAAQRADVRKRFEDSPVTCIGYGSNFEYHSPDKDLLRKNIDQTKEYIRLCKDIGATGIKVKPNTLPTGVPKETTISQIAASLNEVGKFAQDYGQLVRVEAHGTLTSELPNMKAIFDRVTEPNVKICWNSNDVDLQQAGLEANFRMVSRWIGDTVHVRGFGISDYPYPELIRLLAGIDFKGWVLVEASTEPADKVAAMKEQAELFAGLVEGLGKT